jgi:hypothetical protein
MVLSMLWLVLMAVGLLFCLVIRKYVSVQQRAEINVIK